MLKGKFNIGLFNRIEESIERFETLFGWKIGHSGHACQQNKINHAMTDEYAVLPNTVDDMALASLTDKNRIDMVLYDLSRFLFDNQGRVLFGGSMLRVQ